ncbi:tyrosine-type recombinase/integrase [Lysinibacillus capsici]|uniref:tyrosine-type recombinase/integrase n=1 Tax=Lysinibacillus capsici TaxID=2115968 RepID=UPI000E206F3E|nr:tyrosine-type recombinase/integrase [Lysinibacillus capsici]RDV25865.1 integrase [Lysinibacillus capsici]
MLIKFAIQDFLDERKMMNASEYTLINYKSFFKGFQLWLRENGIQDVSDITANSLRLYLTYCKNEKGNGPNTINNKVKNLKAFFNHLIENEYLQHNPCLKLKKQQTDERIEVFTDAHIRQMLRYYRRMKRKDHEFTAYRNTAMIITLLGTGIRLGEMRGLRWSDVSIRHISIFGKNRKLETVPLTEKLYKELMDLKLYYEKYFDDEVEFVFVHRNGEQISYEATKGVFKNLQEVMNFKDIRLSAHTFRHTFAQKFLLNGGDVFTLQKILRHTSLSMTEKYLALWGTALHEQNDKYNPLNNMDI